ncbi:helix-turn-helix domain-containing protein [Halomonas sp. M1]|uniref:helix-turn-helix transcriptional regulator n=1 Tax=Halomonas sp. M1 TaxID=3035470 RepID=UPI00279B3182|nr:helix-turn-helix domain-containing protein [Halomonas sp. M1]
MTSTTSSIKLLNTAEAANLLGLKKNTLEIWRWRGCGPAYKKIGNSVRYSDSDLLDYIESQTRNSTSEHAV